MPRLVMAYLVLAALTFVCTHRHNRTIRDPEGQIQVALAALLWPLFWFAIAAVFFADWHDQLPHRRLERKHKSMQKVIEWTTGRVE